MALSIACTALSSTRRGLLRFRERPALALEWPTDRTEGREQPIEGAEHVVVRDAVVDELATLLAPDETRVLEDPQVLGQRWLAHLEARGDLAGRQRGFRQVSKNLATRHRGKSGKN